jgi:riboflavin synthase
MFSGIVIGPYLVTEIEIKAGLLTITIDFYDENIKIGESIAVNGVCLTVSRKSETGQIVFDVIAETIRVTDLTFLKVNDYVNIELSLKGNQEISGHIVSGHVDDVVEIKKIETPDENNYTIIFRANEEWMKYIFPKGFIALNGCSLTVGFVDRKNNEFCVYLIPETLRRTTFINKKVGDAINLEVERSTQAIVDTMNIFLEKLEAKLINGEIKLRELPYVIEQYKGLT